MGAAKTAQREKGLTLTEVERQPELLLTQTESLKTPVNIHQPTISRQPKPYKGTYFW
jgi:hypothetical protein